MKCSEIEFVFPAYLPSHGAYGRQSVGLTRPRCQNTCNVFLWDDELTATACSTNTYIF
jgi:hypothetical protein